MADVQRGNISQADWDKVLRYRPRHGWPLSSVTALEILAGIDAAPREDFLSVKERIGLAYALCKGRILEDPRFIICKELLHIPAPQLSLPSFGPMVGKHMDVARRANSFDELVSAGVPFRGRRARINQTSIFTEVMRGPKHDWMKTVEHLADEKYPAWRVHFQETGKRLPPELVEQLRPRSAWLALRPNYVKTLLAWLGASDEPLLVDELSVRLDAAMEFVTFITQEFLLRNYSLEKHKSDVFDHFQLLHLALDRFIIVSNDLDLSIRTQKSSQADRIMPFQQFLGTLSLRS